MKFIGSTVTFCVLVAASLVINGWAFSVLWGWFAVPAFSLPQLSIPAAIGVSIMVSFLVMKTEANKDRGKPIDAMIAALGMAVAKCLLMLGVGWVVVQFL